MHGTRVVESMSRLRQWTDRSGGEDRAKRSACLRRKVDHRLSPSADPARQVLRHRMRRHSKAELNQQFVRNPLLTPYGILFCHPSDQFANANVTRVAASTRLGFTPRSGYSASCRRRERISASNESRDRSTSPHQDQIKSAHINAALTVGDCLPSASARNCAQDAPESASALRQFLSNSSQTREPNPTTRGRRRTP